MKASRRGVLAGGAALALPGCGARTRWPGTLGGPDILRGHALRDHRLPPASGAPLRAGVVIAGGGIAGLAAGWRLKRAGFDDFVLLELEDTPGGNARGGRNAIATYPLGAHYLTVPNREARALITMLRDFRLITGDADGVPVYDPYAVTADLDERLFWRGSWQEGLFPQVGLDPAARAQHARFQAAMASFSAAIGHDGRPAFAVPMALSSADPAFTALDAHSFAQWLDAQGFTAAPLRAYLRYCCRDDYGTEPEAVSAWAGIHYFAGRRGWAAGEAHDRELTWPEGNARLAGLMADAIAGHVQTGQVVTRAVAADGGAALDVFDAASATTRRWQAQAAVLAMPHFVAARVVPGWGAARGFRYAPWVVANVSVARHPGGPGVPLAWDNVSAASDSLGYVVATHQTESRAEGPTVLTWYLPLSRETPEAARRILASRSLGEWQAIVADDLLAMHPELDGAITRIDVWRWGHAMIAPAPGFLTDPDRLRAQAARPPLLFAHSDLSGLSLFEEAHYRGVAAAEAALAHCGHPTETLL